MEKPCVTIHFNDGSKLRFHFDRQIYDPGMMASRVQKSIDANQFVFEAKGELIVVPNASIKYLQVHPAPEKLPDTVIKATTVEVL